jgi:hypothetical protein
VEYWLMLIFLRRSTRDSHWVTHMGMSRDD